MECLKCTVADNKSYLKCDGCERPIHTECSGLSATELKVMGLKGARLLKFYCDDCLAGVRLVPQLIRRLDDLQKEMENLKKLHSIGEQTIPDERIFSEIHERQKRTNNIMIFNLPDTNNDSNKAREIFKEITREDLIISKVIRVGKVNKNGNRALKVTCNNVCDVEKILKAKKDKLRGRSIFISADLTPTQYEYIKRLRQEAEVRKQNGENVILKYNRGIPGIVTSASEQKN